jgi:lipoic acid synthetase
VGKGKCAEIDPGEPQRISEAVKRLGLEYVVITSVTRDDLPDGGARQFADTIQAIRASQPGTGVEVLVPDFNRSGLEIVVEAAPAVLGHNMETIPALYRAVRPEADYRWSLQVLRNVKQMQPDMLTKSGMMLGLGEAPEQVVDVMNDLIEAGCDILTLGQYLSPSAKHVPVARYIPPEEFEEYGRIAERLGFKAAVCGPWVRSSHHAARTYRELTSLMRG